MKISWVRLSLQLSYSSCAHMQVFHITNKIFTPITSCCKQIWHGKNEGMNNCVNESNHSIPHNIMWKCQNLKIHFENLLQQSEPRACYSMQQCLCLGHKRAPRVSNTSSFVLLQWRGTRICLLPSCDDVEEHIIASCLAPIIGTVGRLPDNGVLEPSPVLVSIWCYRRKSM